MSFSVMLFWMILAMFEIKGLETGVLEGICCYFGYCMPKTEHVGGFLCSLGIGGALIVLNAVDYCGNTPQKSLPGVLPSLLLSLSDGP